MKDILYKTFLNRFNNKLIQFMLLHVCVTWQTDSGYITTRLCNTAN